ncbi:isoprenylcysteine carboxylmethyltransferase family protein [Planctomycetota bacterium]|nr:isoprenylcysteine carboxylmethyltransferase family protein [Planctomycetota bacterium]
MSRPKRMMPPAYLAISIIVMICLHFIWPEKQLIHWPWRAIGIVLIVLGFALPVWANLLFKQAGTTVKPFQQSSVIVTTGPYRFTRNPIYLGLTIMLIGIAIILGSLLPFFMIPIFVILIRVRVIPIEEKMLRDTFGNSYEEYCKKVRRWI